MLHTHGKLDTRGCLFCSELGSGEYAGLNQDGTRNFVDIREQLDAQKSLTAEKWPEAGYIAYFQNYTNTYAPVEYLRALYDEAISDADVIGLAIATRPDCIDDETIDLFKHYASRGEFWVELGLQTIHSKSIEYIRRHYDMIQFRMIYDKLKAANIKVVLHVIFGIPGESHEDMMSTVDYVSLLQPFGVKFHMLNILKGSDLAIEYEAKPFELLTSDEYIKIICEALRRLDPCITVHRLTGDGPKGLLIAPNWVKAKRAVLNGIHKRLKQDE